MVSFLLVFPENCDRTEKLRFKNAFINKESIFSKGFRVNISTCYLIRSLELQYLESLPVYLPFTSNFSHSDISANCLFTRLTATDITFLKPISYNVVRYVYFDVQCCN